MELSRSIYGQMLSWKKNPERKALMITGARQTGKTYIIRKFGYENYESFIEINFLRDSGARLLFSGKLDAPTLLNNISVFSRKPVIKGKTLIFFDEIQECPEARTAIKFLIDDGSADYVESGSLLGVFLNKIRSMPVGYETELRMYPLSLMEFFTANGISEEIIGYLRTCFSEKRPVSDSVHNDLMTLTRLYLITGGMPEAVSAYVTTRTLIEVFNIQKDILRQYFDDITKYSSTVSEAGRIRSIFERIPSMLNSQGRRFKLSEIDKNARYERYLSGFNWLYDSGIALPSFNLTEPVFPLRMKEKRNLQKLYLCDTGLLCSYLLPEAQTMILNSSNPFNMGRILENFVADELTSKNFDLYYYDSKSNGEVDFVISSGEAVIPLEVKSGNDYRKHSSLDKMLLNDEWKLNRAYVICPGNIEERGKITYIPWYMTMFIEKPVQTINVNLPDFSSMKVPEK